MHREVAKGTPDPKNERASAFFTVGNADVLYEFHVSNGVEIAQPIADRSWGIRDYLVSDPYGNNLVFGHHLMNAGPPLKIERVEVLVRLERRLAALLEELARHKRMTVGSISKR